MAKVTVQIDRNTGEPETIESLIRRFRKQVLNDNILYECKKREYFKPKSILRKEKSIEAQKRLKTKQRKNRNNNNR